MLEYINETARGMLTAISAGTRYVFKAFSIVEDGLRYLSSGLGLNNEAQTLLALFILLKGRVRTLLTFLLALILLHALEHIARGPVDI